MWPKDLIKKVKMIRKIEPILHINQFATEEYKEYDLVAIILRIFDYVVENMGLTAGVTREDIVEHVIPDLRRYDKYIERKKTITFYEELAIYVINKLLNKGERTSFFQEYMDYGEEIPVKRMQKYALLSEHQASDGRIVIRATYEAVNIFLQALEINLEDERSAKLLLMSIQIDKGKVSNALDTAKVHQQLTNYYSNYIDQQIEQTKRDILHVDWQDEMPGKLNDALKHVEECIEEEVEIKRRLSADKEIFIEDPEKADTVQDIISLMDILEKTHERHVYLHGKIMDARSVFRAEQERQIFKSQFDTGALNLEGDVIEKVLTQEVGEHKKFMELVYPYIGGIHPPKLISMNAFINWLLKPITKPKEFKGDKKTKKRISCEEPMKSIVNIEIESRAISIIEQCIHQNNKPLISLSDILIHAEELGEAIPVQLAIKYIILGRFISPAFREQELSPNLQVVVSRDEFVTRYFAGKNFTIIQQLPGGMQSNA